MIAISNKSRFLLCKVYALSYRGCPEGPEVWVLNRFNQNIFCFVFPTGEEEEKAVFAYRAKLFRFDGDANQWKEKGLGEMKILQHKENGNYYSTVTSGPSCSKLETSLDNVSLKFQTLILQIHCYFLFSTKNNSVFVTFADICLTNLCLNDIVKLTML